MSSESKGTKFMFDMGEVQLTPEQGQAIEARINAVVMEELAKIDNSKAVGIVSYSSLLEHKEEIDAKLGGGSIADFIEKYGGRWLDAAAINPTSLRGA